MMIVALALIAAAPPSADDALRHLEIQNAAAQVKQERAMDAVEKTLSKQPERCPACAPCTEPRTIELRAPTLEPATVVPSQSQQPPVPRPRVPLWAWILGTALIATATGAAFAGIVMEATHH